jgi:diaminohydroxyphosphoribosylaminopyrimidine deaminase / 5-amino-6-(5-phosphoribosylamino)uracil reductase
VKNDSDPFSAIDHAMMARALRLAERGLFTTRPNPRVGCVLANAGEIVGEGWHVRAGGPHAEVYALRAAGKRARGATAYVTLEPCAHFGRTPPCADALVEAGVARVVAACEDPNPGTAGAGLTRLREAGVGVESGLMHAAARELNRGFFSRIEKGRPWVRVKLAMSLDGRTALADGRSKWITGESARADVQRWRARSSAILTGAGTARVDDPGLTVRTGGPSEDDLAAPPVLRVVLDARLDALAPDARLLDGGAPTLVLHAPGTWPRDDRYALTELCEVATDRRGRIDLDAALSLLAARGINELQVEAGAVLCGALLEGALVDEMLLYVAPVLLGDAARPLLHLPALSGLGEARRLHVIEQRQVGEDWRLLLRPRAATRN